MSEWLTVTEATIDEHFEGVMIWIHDFDVGDHKVPGWKCNHCGWTVGSLGLSRGHRCPDEGLAQQPAPQAGRAGTDDRR